MESEQAELLGQPSGSRKERARALKRELEFLLDRLKAGKSQEAVNRMNLLLNFIRGFLVSCQTEEAEEEDFLKG